MAHALTPSREVYRDTYNPQVFEHYKSVTKERMRVADEEQQQIINDALASVERALVVNLITPSGHHKLHNMHKRIGRESDPEIPHFPFLFDHPDVVEEKINRKKITIESPLDQSKEIIDLGGEPAVMALCKATRLFPLPDSEPFADAIRIHNINEYLELAYAVNSLEAKHLQPAYPLNRRGRHVLSAGHDTVVYHKKGTDIIPLHQPRELTTQDAQFAFLSELFDLQERRPIQAVEFVLKDAMAVYDVGLDFAAVSRNEHLVQYDRMTTSLLAAYVYGIDHPLVDMRTREEVMTVYNSFPQSDAQHKTLFRGWTPEKGIDPEVTRKVNGSLLNQCPIIWLADSRMRNTLLVGRPTEAIAQQQSLIDIVSGNPKAINRLIRGIIQVAIAYETDREIEELFKTKQSMRYTAIANALTTEFGGKQVMTSSVIDFTHYLDELRLTDEYVDALYSHYKRQ